MVMSLGKNGQSNKISDLWNLDYCDISNKQFWFVSARHHVKIVVIRKTDHRFVFRPIHPDDQCFGDTRVPDNTNRLVFFLFSSMGMGAFSASFFQDHRFRPNFARFFCGFFCILPSFNNLLKNKTNISFQFCLQAENAYIQNLQATKYKKHRTIFSGSKCSCRVALYLIFFCCFFRLFFAPFFSASIFYVLYLLLVFFSCHFDLFIYLLSSVSFFFWESQLQSPRTQSTVSLFFVSRASLQMFFIRETRLVMVSIETTHVYETDWLDQAITLHQFFLVLMPTWKHWRGFHLFLQSTAGFLGRQLWGSKQYGANAHGKCCFVSRRWYDAKVSSGRIHWTSRT